MRPFGFSAQGKVSWWRAGSENSRISPSGQKIACSAESRLGRTMPRSYLRTTCPWPSSTPGLYFRDICLLISKTHYETIADIPKDLIGRLFSNAQDLAAVVKSAMQAEGTFVAVNNTVSQSVPHFHVHIVPRRRRDGLRGFFWPRHGYSSEEEMAAVRDVLSSRLKKSISNPSS